LYAFRLVREGAEVSMFRGTHLHEQRTILIAAAATDKVAREAAQSMHNEFALRERLDESWARKPYASGSRDGGMVLVYPDDTAQTLDERCTGALGLDSFFPLAIAMAEALVAAHAVGIVHRSLSPASFLIADDGGCRLAGFGRACVAGTTAAAYPKSTAGVIPAVLPYMSPEHTGRTALAPDARSDLYSLGVILFQLLTGHLPFTASQPDAAAGWIHAHLASEPALAPQLAAGLPDVVSRMLARLLAKDAGERYQSAAALGADLERCRRMCKEQRAIPEFLIPQHEQAAAPAFADRLYGRQQALDELAAAGLRVRAEGTFGVSFVHGPAGIGKSALVAGLLADPRLGEVTVIHARADQYAAHARAERPATQLRHGARAGAAGR
jgi:hypothetical protein